jgi:hypothetical protein
MPTTLEEVEALSLDELRALVAQFGDEPGELTQLAQLELVSEST